MRKFLIIILFLSLTLFAKEKIELKTLKNENIHISNYEGNLIFENIEYKDKNILFFFFGTRCPYCIEDIPDVNIIDKNENGTKVIGVHGQYEISDRELKPFIKEKNIEFEVLSKKSATTVVNHLVNRNLWLGGVPYYIFIDRHGNLEPMTLNEVKKSLK